MNEASPAWEQKTLEKLLLETLTEQRRRRRWGIFFKSFFLFYLLLFLYAVWPENEGMPTEKEHIGLVSIEGEIASDLSANGSDIIEGLDTAFKDKMTKAVILDIDSPGGSPVQAETVYNELIYLRHKYPKIKTYTVCSDLCTSAAYYIAAGSDQIYASPTSLVGSIGVLLDGFGFVDSMQKLGVQRRLLISGDHKGFLDPFSPLKPDEVKDAQGLLDNVHAQFIHDVKVGRGERLKETPDIFSGLVWTGSQALPLGLIDGLGDVNFVARQVIHNDVIVDYTVKPSYLEQFANRISSSFAEHMGEELRLHWQS